MDVAKDAGSNSGPVFIVGSMGSGTTLMRLVIDSHENIAIAQETGFARALLAQKWIPYWKHGGEWYGRIGYSEAQLEEEMRDYFDHMFRRFAESQGKPRWGDKTPWHLWHMEMLASVFPDAAFIGTLRHPGAVASSQRNRFGWDWHRSVRHWVRSNIELAYTGARLGNRFSLCRYEDLVLEPERTMRPVFEWLGEPWSPRVLEHHVVQGQRGTRLEVEGNTRVDDPIDPSRVAKWTQSMDEEGWSELRNQTTHLSDLFGYHANDPMALEPLLPGAGDALVTGGPLQARLDEFADRVDWVHRPKPIPEDRLLKKMRPTVVQAAPDGSVAALGRRAARRLPAPVRDRLRRLRGTVRARG